MKIELNLKKPVSVTTKNVGLQSTDAWALLLCARWPAAIDSNSSLVFVAEGGFTNKNLQ